MAMDTSIATELEEWQADLHALFDQIIAWLGEMDIKPQITRHRIQINEQRYGLYEAEELLITHQGHQMKVRPIARQVAGADGRVDILGIEGPFILVNLKDQGGWHYLADRAIFDLRRLEGNLFRRLVGVCLQ
jgi:hypothetical protein